MLLQFELHSFIRKFMPQSPWIEFYLGDVCFNYDECGIVTISNNDDGIDYLY